ncbi:hypothetical protein SAMN05192533_11427 [Mesobacillus persicus]|uniref:Lysophospholipase L1 n=1 Tax=Mesobacillus persicus TaxID=930146 RepID=A0A1H8GZS5_9BACI|nr:SGNH/GDSL hydrolase family protein [Mesobacillus persicus]SEN49224.1 hypothetical protein SAMN05192533_11427 [Mesobacillus persicus]
MKRFLVTLLAIGCVAILIIGNKHWKEKTSVSAEKVKQEVIMKDEGQAKEDVKEEEKVDTEQLLKFASNWPAKAKDSYQQALVDGQPFTILIAGSLSLGTEDNSWSQLVKKDLEETYGDTVNVVVKTYNHTSASFLTDNKLAELIAEKPDLTLLEPFTLMNNGNVNVSVAHQHIMEIASGLADSNANHVLVLHPTNPLYQANYYPIQVDSLQKFAEAEAIPYLNHWTAWPDPNSEEIQDYLIGEGSETKPSEKGHQLWAEYIVDYFIAK